MGLNINISLKKDKQLEQNIKSLMTLITNTIPDQGAHIEVTVIALPAKGPRRTLYELFPKVFKPSQL